jgi:hypothetical protein
MNTKVIVIFALVCVAALVFRELVSGESLSPNTNQEISRYTMQVANDGTIYILDTREGLLLYGTRTSDFKTIDTKSELLGLSIDRFTESVKKLDRFCDSLRSTGETASDSASIMKTLLELMHSRDSTIR